jgi:hypothetical protein
MSGGTGEAGGSGSGGGQLNILCRFGLHLWTKWVRVTNLSQERHCTKCGRTQNGCVLVL